MKGAGSGANPVACTMTGRHGAGPADWAENPTASQRQGTLRSNAAVSV